MTPQLQQEFPDQFPTSPAGPRGPVVAGETDEAHFRMVCMHRILQFLEQEVTVHLSLRLKEVVEF